MGVQGKVHSTILGLNNQFYTTNTEVQLGEIVYVTNSNMVLRRLLRQSEHPKSPPIFSIDGRECSTQVWGSHERILAIYEPIGLDTIILDLSGQRSNEVKM